MQGESIGKVMGEGSIGKGGCVAASKNEGAVGEVDFIDEAGGEKGGVEPAAALTKEAADIPLGAQPDEGGREIKGGLTETLDGVSEFFKRGAAGGRQLGGCQHDERCAGFSEEAGAQVGTATAADEDTQRGTFTLTV